PVLQKTGTENARINDRLAGTVGAGGIHHVRGITEQRGMAVHPGGHRLTVDHRVFEDLAGPAQHAGDVDPVVVPALEVMHEFLVRHTPVPVAVAPAGAVVHGDFGDPVDIS